MKFGKSLAKPAAILVGILGLAALAAPRPASAQTYVCPPGYYFLANYGCYPFSGYAYYPPAPAYAYPSYPYYAAPFGLSFRFGAPFFHDRGHFDHFGHGHR